MELVQRYRHDEATTRKVTAYGMNTLLGIVAVGLAVNVANAYTWEQDWVYDTLLMVMFGAFLLLFPLLFTGVHTLDMQRRRKHAAYLAYTAETDRLAREAETAEEPVFTPEEVLAHLEAQDTAQAAALRAVLAETEAYEAVEKHLRREIIQAQRA